MSYEREPVISKMRESKPARVETPVARAERQARHRALPKPTSSERYVFGAVRAAQSQGASATRVQVKLPTTLDELKALRKGPLRILDEADAPPLADWNDNAESA